MYNLQQNLPKKFRFNFFSIGFLITCQLLASRYVLFLFFSPLRLSQLPSIFHCFTVLSASHFVVVLLFFLLILFFQLPYFSHQIAFFHQIVCSFRIIFSFQIIFSFTILSYQTTLDYHFTKCFFPLLFPIPPIFAIFPYFCNSPYYSSYHIFTIFPFSLQIKFQQHVSFNLFLFLSSSLIPTIQEPTIHQMTDSKQQFQPFRPFQFHIRSFQLQTLKLL